MSTEGISLFNQFKQVQEIQTPGGSGLAGSANAPAGKGASFGDFLDKSLEHVNKSSLEADMQLQKTTLGEEPNYHKTLIAMQKADVSFRMMLSVKQRLEQAYRQVIQTQV